MFCHPLRYPHFLKRNASAQTTLHGRARLPDSYANTECPVPVTLLSQPLPSRVLLPSPHSLSLSFVRSIQVGWARHTTLNSHRGRIVTATTNTTPILRRPPPTATPPPPRLCLPLLNLSRRGWGACRPPSPVSRRDHVCHLPTSTETRNAVTIRERLSDTAGRSGSLRSTPHTYVAARRVAYP